MDEDANEHQNRGDAPLFPPKHNETLSASEQLEHDNRKACIALLENPVAALRAPPLSSPLHHHTLSAFELEQGTRKLLEVIDDPMFVPYFRMLASGVPISDVRQKMGATGLNATLLDTPHAPSPNKYPPGARRRDNVPRSSQQGGYVAGVRRHDVSAVALRMQSPKYASATTFIPPTWHQPPGPWACEVCTFINDTSGGRNCSMCTYSYTHTHIYIYIYIYIYIRVLFFYLYY